MRKNIQKYWSYIEGNEDMLVEIASQMHLLNQTVDTLTQDIHQLTQTHASGQQDENISSGKQPSALFYNKDRFERLEIEFSEPPRETCALQ